MEKLILETFLPYRLSRLSAAVSERLKGAYGKKYLLTVPEWRVLATLGQFQQLTAKQVGKHSSMHKTKVSRAVAELESRRWVVREVNPKDRREELLSLSKLGESYYNLIFPEMTEFDRDLQSKLNPTDIDALHQALSALEHLLGFKAGRVAQKEN